MQFKSLKLSQLPIILLSAFLLLASSIFAGSSEVAGSPDGTFGAMADDMTGQMGEFGSMLVAVAFVAGIGFVVVALFKFKQHKDNPTQVTIGTPAMLLFIGIFLIYLPNLITTGGSTVGYTSSAGLENQSKGTATSGFSFLI